MNEGLAAGRRRIVIIKRGDRFTAMGCQIEVRRVSKDQQWADIFVYQLSSRTSWTKRQPLPFPSDWRIA